MCKPVFSKIWLLFHPKRESYFALKKILGFFPRKISFYEEALMHSSYSRNNSDGKFRSNERLEFLGDALFGAIIAEFVFRKYQRRDEGFLTSLRSKIVKRETMDSIARELGLDQLIISAPQLVHQKNHVIGNALEAFIGALYLDHGYRKTCRFVEQKIIHPFIDIDKLVKKEVNFKSKLLEWSQRNRVSIEYNLIDASADSDYSNCPLFQSEVLLNGVIAGTGVGYTKKESQQQAAHFALKKIKKDKEFVGRVKDFALNVI